MYNIINYNKNYLNKWINITDLENQTRSNFCKMVSNKQEIEISDHNRQIVKDNLFHISKKEIQQEDQ